MSEDEQNGGWETTPEEKEAKRAKRRKTDDDEIRALFVTLITFVAGARASHDMKNDALDAVQKLQARLLP
jgi:hypothetical protein